jgi:hypothetical protein
MGDSLIDVGDKKTEQTRTWLSALGIFLGSLVAGFVLAPVLSGAMNMALWMYLIEVTSLRGDTWEFWTWGGASIVAAPAGAIAAPIGAFVGRRRGTGTRRMVLGSLIGIMLVVVAAMVLLYVSIYPG